MKTKIKKTQPVSCLGKMYLFDEAKAKEKAQVLSKKFRLKYDVYKCIWCTKTNLKDTYHLATVKDKSTKKKCNTYLEYYRKPIVVPRVRPHFLVRLYRASKHAYGSFMFHIK